MKPTHFRAYTAETVESRREVDGVKQNVSHEVETAAFDGKLSNGVANFDAGKVKVSRVVFLAGQGDGETVVGSVEVGKSGKISAELAD